MKKLFSGIYKSKNGFTLVELLVVIAILAILGTIGVLIFSGTQSRARDSKRKEDIYTMVSAMEAHYVAGNGYTTPLQDSWFLGNKMPTNLGPGGSAYYTTYTGTTAYVFCSALENANGNSTTPDTITGSTTGQYFCKRNAQ